MVRRLIIVLMLSGVVYSCSTDSGSSSSDEFEIPDSLFEDEPLVVAEEVLEDIIQNVSSPIELAALIKNSGVPFSQKYMCGTEKAGQFTSSFQKALNLGIYGADLGYLNIYDKTGSAIDYISAIKILSEDLKVGQFFDFTTLKRLATNNTDLDSLMYISVSSFNRMDRYLRENSRGNISTLIITGVWVEGLYIATQVVKEKHIDEIAERIGEQKLVLGDLLIILKNYRSDAGFMELITRIEELRKIYDDVTISYELGEPEASEEDGILKIIQHETSHIQITEEQLVKIVTATEDIRNFIINV
ncbi:MAG: hypothetical protein KJ607_01790 [Bacteroidetes bacterium]|nr:hypothetical protein [Bacteroidota bacterium]